MKNINNNNYVDNMISSLREFNKNIKTEMMNKLINDAIKKNNRKIEMLTSYDYMNWIENYISEHGCIDTDSDLDNKDKEEDLIHLNEIHDFFQGILSYITDISLKGYCEEKDSSCSCYVKYNEDIFCFTTKLIGGYTCVKVKDNSNIEYTDYSEIVEYYKSKDKLKIKVKKESN